MNYYSDNYAHVTRFDSPEAYGDWLEQIPQEYVNMFDSDSFYGHSYKEALSKLYSGDTSQLDAAKQVMDQLQIDDLVSELQSTLVPTIAGFIPNVPALVAGHPEGMFKRQYIESPNVVTPLTVYVDVIVSGGLTHTELIKRGVACLAFVLAMETIRPVDLYTVQCTTGRSDKAYITTTKIASRPMDLGRAVWMLTNPSYARRLAFTGCSYLTGRFAGGWAFGGPSNNYYEKGMRKALEMLPTDVFIKGGHLYDDLMLTNPVKWVRKMVEQHKTSQ